MRPYFLDTSYLIALFNQNDRFHQRANELAETIRQQRSRCVTTLLVLEEFLTDLSRRDASIKAEAALFADRILAEPTFDIVPITLDLFVASLSLYRRRLDKSYSMVDCISMMVCTEREIAEVLTSDRDFEQERFVALLRQ